MMRWLWTVAQAWFDYWTKGRKSVEGKVTPEIMDWAKQAFDEDEEENEDG